MIVDLSGIVYGLFALYGIYLAVSILIRAVIAKFVRSYYIKNTITILLPLCSLVLLLSYNFYDRDLFGTFSFNEERYTAPYMVPFYAISIIVVVFFTYLEKKKK
jgi:energy-coupling factor transporter transmembrane protein EcfT